MAQLAQPVNINTLHKFHEEAHTARSWNECESHNQLALDAGLFSRIPSRMLHQCLIVSMLLRHKEAWVDEHSLSRVILRLISNESNSMRA